MNKEVHTHFYVTHLLLHVEISNYILMSLANSVERFIVAKKKKIPMLYEKNDGIFSWISLRTHVVPAFSQADYEV